MSPSDYVGYDRQLGLCLCKADDLEEVCDLKCRKQSNYQLTLVCAGEPLEPYIHIRDENNSTLVSKKKKNQIGAMLSSIIFGFHVRVVVFVSVKYFDEDICCNV